MMVKDVKLILSILAVFFCCVHAKDSSSSEERFQYKCANKYYRYYLDKEPAEYGLSAGFYAPGKKAYVGLGIWLNSMPSSGQLQLNPPGIYISGSAGPGTFVNDSKQIWYLYKNKHHRYEWVKSDNGKQVPFAVEFGKQNSGAEMYVGRIKKNNFTYPGTTMLTLSTFFYLDANLITRKSVTYEVLTCKSCRKEKEIPMPNFLPKAPPNIDSPSGCVNNWQPYNFDDAPAKNGISAGTYDCGNEAYVGSGNLSGVNGPGRLQIVENKGLYIAYQKKNFYLNDSSVRYLVNNPNYTYRWENYNQIPPSNLVLARTPVGHLALGIARKKFNGHMKVGYITPPIAYFSNIDGTSDETHLNYEILVCDPWPKYQCGQQWRKLDSKLATDGFSIDGSSFIGRSTRKCVNGCDYGLGRIQTGSNGVNYLDDLTATAVFDNSSNVEYLVKNSSYFYRWVPSSNGVKVANALELRSSYIGMTFINEIPVFGKVRPGEGLFFIDPVTGSLQTSSAYEVLTCTSADASNGEFKEDSTSCQARKEWSVTEWRYVCRKEFKNIFVSSGAQWNEETCSYIDA